MMRLERRTAVAACENFIPIRFWIAALKVHARDFQQPTGIVEIEIHAQSVQPLKQYRPRIGLLLDQQKLISGGGKLFQKVAARSIRRLATLDAVRIETREPALRGPAIGA